MTQDDPSQRLYGVVLSVGIFIGYVALLALGIFALTMIVAGGRMMFQ
jgi:hypothetical protein